MDVIRASAQKRMPWKNGGGVTTEIAASPTGALLDNFEWRVSMAEVRTDGPFSKFLGIDRTLVVVRGDGVRLQMPDAVPVSLTAASAPFAFPADVDVAATLIGGPVIDLNVMTRRGQWEHRIQRLAVAGEMVVRPSTDVWMFICTDGVVAVSDDAGVAQLAAGDAVRGGGRGGTMTLSGPMATVFWVKIWL